MFIIAIANVLCCLLDQLTRFQGDGGFAVGVSCSLMLSDPLSLARFLASWARTHARMKAQNDVATHPLMQYASYFQRPGARAVRALIKSIPLGPSTLSPPPTAATTSPKPSSSEPDLPPPSQAHPTTTCSPSPVSPRRRNGSARRARCPCSSQSSSSTTSTAREG